jgi:tetratricopeptide (TPR) repeat protein
MHAAHVCGKRRSKENSMKLRCMILAAGVCLAATAAWAVDSVKTTKDTRSISGRIISMTSTEVVVEQTAGKKTIPVNEIATIVYDEDPPQLRTARGFADPDTARYEDALSQLEKIKLSGTPRAEIQQDVDFLRAYCTAQLALEGKEGYTVLGAAKEMKDFIAAHKGSYRWLKANEVFGDLAVAAGNLKAAETYYDQLRKSPFPDYKMRAGILIGRVLMAQGGVANLAAAGKAFDEALAVPGDTDAAKAQRLDATLGKTRLLALGGKSDEAIKAVEPIIAAASREQTETLAHAYNTLGVAYRAAKKPKEALLAFLHVELLYSSTPEAHAEALFNLAALWMELGNGQRAEEAKKSLLQKYGNSLWAKKLPNP